MFLLIRITYRNELNQNRIKVSKQSPDAFYVSMIFLHFYSDGTRSMVALTRLSVQFSYFVDVSDSPRCRKSKDARRKLHLLFILYSFIPQDVCESCFLPPNQLLLLSTQILLRAADTDTKNSRTHLMNKNLIRNAYEHWNMYISVQHNEHRVAMTGRLEKVILTHVGILTC